MKIKFLTPGRAAAMAAKTKKTTQRFNSSMLIALLLVCAVSVKLTVVLGESRRLPSDYKQMDSTIAQLQTEVDEINKIQVAPKLEGSWKKANAITIEHGVDFKVLESAGSGQQVAYGGPLHNWSAQLIGQPSLVLAVAMKIQRQVPTFLYDYSISGGIMKLTITVVGT